MFVFSDPDLLKAVVAAHQRGVKTRVMLNAARRSGEDDNEHVRKALEHAGIAVKDSNPEFAITHEKSMVVDEAVAFVKSLNWATKNLTETRDYAITTTHPHGVGEVIACFDADWHRQEFKPGESAHLIWCPANGRERIAQFIDADQRLSSLEGICVWASGLGFKALQIPTFFPHIFDARQAAEQPSGRGAASGAGGAPGAVLSRPADGCGRAQAVRPIFR
jgi:polyphosphate kinase